MVVIVFIAGLTGHYVFVTVLVGFVSTFGVLKKTTDEDMTNEDTTNENTMNEGTTNEDTTNEDTTKARNESLNGDKVFIENEIEMTTGTKENAEDAKAEISEVIKTESGGVRENEETAIESPEEEPTADTTVERSETSTIAQVDLVEPEVTKENESQGEEPMAETKVGTSHWEALKPAQLFRLSLWGLKKPRRRTLKARKVNQRLMSRWKVLKPAKPLRVKKPRRRILRARKGSQGQRKKVERRRTKMESQKMTRNVKNRLQRPM